jgi:Spy/CpxP family protein refolding chaperone
MKTSMLQVRPMRLLVATAVLALAGGLAQTAVAMPGYGPGYGMGYGPGHGMGYGSPGGYGAGPRMGTMGGGMGMMGGPGAARWLDGVGATAEQKAQLQTIHEAARNDMEAIRQSGRTLREQMRTALAQPNVDAPAVEAIRKQMLAQHELASKRMTQAMLDASRVLTPEQRKQMSEQFAQRRAMMERHRAEREALGGGPGRP